MRFASAAATAGIVIGLGVFAVFAVGAASRSAASQARRAAREQACPPGFAPNEDDETRAARVSALVRTVAPERWQQGGQAGGQEGAQEGAQADGPELGALADVIAARACFGPAEGEGVTTSGALGLARVRDDRAAAARGAHLALHLVEGEPGDAPRDPRACAAWLARARAAEERADAVEGRVARALGAQLDARPVEARVADYARRCP